LALGRRLATSPGGAIMCTIVGRSDRPEGAKVCSQWREPLESCGATAIKPRRGEGL